MADNEAFISSQEIYHNGNLITINIGDLATPKKLYQDYLSFSNLPPYKIVEITRYPYSDTFPIAYMICLDTGDIQVDFYQDNIESFTHCIDSHPEKQSTNYFSLRQKTITAF